LLSRRHCLKHTNTPCRRCDAGPRTTPKFHGICSHIWRGRQEMTAEYCVFTARTAKRISDKLIRGSNFHTARRTRAIMLVTQSATCVPSDIENILLFSARITHLTMLMQMLVQINTYVRMHRNFGEINHSNRETEI